jgi:hypothetical protein
MDSDPDSDLQALDADPDPTNRFDRILIHNTACKLLSLNNEAQVRVFESRRGHHYEETFPSSSRAPRIEPELPAFEQLILLLFGTSTFVDRNLFTIVQCPRANIK